MSSLHLRSSHAVRPAMVFIRRSIRKTTKLGGVICVAIFFSSCTIVDEFADRAVEYNQQVADAQNRQVLLNILRAAHRQPMQFTELSTIAGGSTATGALSLSVPFGGDASAYSASPSISLEGRQDFTLVNLNTQEFYNGILTPVSPKTLAHYLSEGWPAEIVLTLLVSSVDFQLTDSSGKTNVVSYYNRGDDHEEYAKFKFVLESLLDNKPDIEEVTTIKRIGAPLLGDDLKDLDGVSDLIAQGVALTKYNIDDSDNPISESEVKGLKRTGVDHYYILEKYDSEFRLCLRNNAQPLSVPEEIHERGRIEVPPGAMCSTSSVTEVAERAKVEEQAGVVATDGESFSIFLGPRQRLKGEKGAKADRVEERVEMSVRTRSVQNAIYYLGEIARCQLDLERTFHRDSCPTIKRSGEEVSLVTVRPSGGARAVAVVSFSGDLFSVPMLPSNKDRSGQVFDLITQLLAANKVAKDFPAPSVITVSR